MNTAAIELDYRHLRDDAGAYELPRDVVRLEGPDAAGYLQGQCSQDLSALAVGQAADTLLLEPDGKISALARVIRVGEETYQLDVDGGFGGPLEARLARFKLRSKFSLEALPWVCLALRGPAAAGTDGVSAPVVAPFEWNGWAGVDLLGPPGSIEVPDSIARCGADAWEAARIESGIPAMGHELTEGVIPAEAGVVGRTVSFTKGCFTGQELVARIDSRGAATPHRLCALVFDGDVEPAAVLGGSLSVEGKERSVGRVTSAAWCPAVHATAALAFVHRSVLDPESLRVEPVGATGDSVSAAIRTLPLA